MHSYLTPEEPAQYLKVDVTEIMPLIEQGKLGAIRIGNNIRIPEPKIKKLLVTCAAGPTVSGVRASFTSETLPDNSRLIPTRSGRAMFRVTGSVASGADIWPGKMRYPIKLPKSFMTDL